MHYSIVMPAPCDPVLTILPAAITIAVGERAHAVGMLDPCMANRRVTWRSADTMIAAVVESHDSTDGGTAVVLGRGAGRTTLIMIWTQDPTRSAGAIVTVLAPPGPGTTRLRAQAGGGR